MIIFINALLIIFIFLIITSIITYFEVYDTVFVPHKSIVLAILFIVAIGLNTANYTGNPTKKIHEEIQVDKLINSNSVVGKDGYVYIFDRTTLDKIIEANKNPEKYYVVKYKTTKKESDNVFFNRRITIGYKLISEEEKNEIQ